MSKCFTQSLFWYLLGHVCPQPVESTLGLQPHVEANSKKAITTHVSSTLYTRYKEHKFTSLQRGSLGLWVMKLYFLQLIRHSQQVLGQKWTFTSYEWCKSWSDKSVAVALQVVNAAWLMAALLHDASLHLGLLAARQSLPQPLLLSGPFRQEPFEVEKVFMAPVLKACGCCCAKLQFPQTTI